jgi:soluble lytic murein transglycosylase-like protein
MQAISLVESGRPDPEKGANVAWPWTINAEGKGAYFATKAEAVAEVARLRGRGVRSIDVGCMQVNLHHHGEAFASLEEAFDPLANALYAAAFLNQLKEETETWPLAVQRYHSATPEKGQPYQAKVDRKWRQEHARLAEDQRRDAAETTRLRRSETIARHLQASGQRQVAPSETMTEIATKDAEVRNATAQLRTPETPPINQAMNRLPVRLVQFQAPPARTARALDRFIPIQRTAATE